MISKLFLLLSLLIGAFLTFTCVNENKTKLTNKYSQALQAQENITPAVTQPVEKVVEKKVEVVEEVPKMDEALFSYEIAENTKFTAKLSPKNKSENLEVFLSVYCPVDSCKQDITFDENTKESTWQDDAIRIASFLKDNDIKNASVKLKGKSINIEGDLKNQEEMDTLNTLLESFAPDTFEVKNITTISQKIEQKTVEVAQSKVEEAKVGPTREEIQSQIVQLLKDKPIYFQSASAIIIEEGKSTLDKIISAVESLGSVGLKVEGHTDAAGNKSYNMFLSQQRADAVKKYLSSNGLSDISVESIGLGETKPISQNPRDKINRRVEIYLLGGE